MILPVDILYPYADKLTSLDEAIMLTKTHGGHLHILYTYRLFHKPEPATLGSPLEMRRQEIHTNLEAMRQKLDVAGIAYTLKVEIGFMKDRLAIQLDNHPFDTVLIDPKHPEFKEIQQAIREHHQSAVRILAS